MNVTQNRHLANYSEFIYFAAPELDNKTGNQKVQYKAQENE